MRNKTRYNIDESTLSMNLLCEDREVRAKKDMHVSSHAYEYVNLNSEKFRQ